jgi:rubrerythrin
MSEEVIEAYTCPICGKQFESAKGLAGHLRLAHEKPTKQNGVQQVADGVADRVIEKQRDVLEQHDEALLKRISALEEAVKARDTPVREHKTIEEIASCPDCAKRWKVDEYTNKVILKALRKEWLDRMNSELECEACGFPVFKEEKACPICGSTKGRGREDRCGYDPKTWVIKPEQP